MLLKFSVIHFIDYFFKLYKRELRFGKNIKKILLFRIFFNRDFFDSS